MPKIPPPHRWGSCEIAEHMLLRDQLAGRVGIQCATGGVVAGTGTGSGLVGETAVGETAEGWSWDGSGRCPQCQGDGCDPEGRCRYDDGCAPCAPSAIREDGEQDG